MKRLLASSFCCFSSSQASAPRSAQDWIRTGTGLGVEKIRLAVPDFKVTTNDPVSQGFAITFNNTLWNDLQAAGIFDMVGKSFYPMAPPGAPQDVRLADWDQPPPNANMLAFGNLGVRWRIPERARLALRREERAVAAGAGQAVSRRGQRRQCTRDRAPLRR